MSGEARPLVSVLVPAFNAETTLAETLQSALASSYPNLEIVIVDDGSTDRTLSVAENFARADERVRIFRQPHQGISAALNRGLAQVRGDYVARLDSDDLWHPTKLEKQVDLIVADPQLALVYTFVRYLDAEGRVVDDVSQKLGKHAFGECLYNGIIGGGSSVLFRRSVLERVGGYDEELSIWEDLVLHLKAAAEGNIAFVPEYLTGYRLRPNSSSHNLRRSLESCRLAKRRMENAFPQLPAFVHDWSHARRLLDLAEGFALEGAYIRSAKLVAECLVRDFVRTSSLLVYRGNRRLTGARRRVREAGPLFGECCTLKDYALADFDAGEGRIRALDIGRNRLLQSLDREIAERRRAAVADARRNSAVAAP